MLLSSEIIVEGVFILDGVGTELPNALRRAEANRPGSLEHAQTDMRVAQELGRTYYLRQIKWDGRPYKKRPGRQVVIAT